MRYFAFLLSVFLFCSLFFGCSVVAHDMGTSSKRFEQVYYVNLDSDNHVRYYRDCVTDVMYICFTGYRKAGMTIMFDPTTGLPLTYSAYSEMDSNS